jgi:hypothetical protein
LFHFRIGHNRNDKSKPRVKKKKRKKDKSKPATRETQREREMAVRQRAVATLPSLIRSLRKESPKPTNPSALLSLRRAFSLYERLDQSHRQLPRRPAPLPTVPSIFSRFFPLQNAMNYHSIITLFLQPSKSNPFSHFNHTYFA